MAASGPFPCASRLSPRTRWSETVPPNPCASAAETVQTAARARIAGTRAPRRTPRIMGRYCRRFPTWMRMSWGVTNIAKAASILDEPLGRPGALSTRLARRCVVRLARARRALGAASPAATRPRAGGLLGALSSTLDLLTSEMRDRALRGPDVRGFLSETETWLAIRRVASEIVALGPRRRTRRQRALARLFDRIAGTE